MRSCDPYQVGEVTNSELYNMARLNNVYGMRSLQERCYLVTQFRAQEYLFGPGGLWYPLLVVNLGPSIFDVTELLRWRSYGYPMPDGKD